MKFVQSLTTLTIVSSIFAIGYLFVFQPVSETQDQLRANLVSQTQEIQSLEVRLSALNSSETQINFPTPMLIKAKDEIEAALLLQDIMIDLLDSLSLEVSSFGTSHMQRDTEQGTVSFEFEAHASLKQVFEFLSHIEDTEPRIAVGNLRIRRATRSDIEENGSVPVWIQMTAWAFFDGDQT